MLWHISDTHCLHSLLQVPDVDIIIHSGDCSNTRDPHINANEVLAFLEWYSRLTAPIKILVAGNHDTSIERRLIRRDQIADMGIIYLENQTATIPYQGKDMHIWGSPYTPTFGNNWAFNIKRSKINAVWDNMDEGVDIVVTHGPPKGILDRTLKSMGVLEMVGCENLRKRILQTRPMYHLFGHVHDSKAIHNNFGVYKDSHNITYSNASCVLDGNKGSLRYNGNILVLDPLK